MCFFVICFITHLFCLVFMLHQNCTILMEYSCCCSVAKSCPTLCDPTNCSTPGFPVLHYLPEFALTHAHWVSDAISSSVTHFSSCLQSFPASGSLPMSQLFKSGSQSFGASTAVLLMNIQDWFPLGLAGLIFLQSKGLSRVSSSTTVWKHQFFSI